MQKVDFETSLGTVRLTGRDFASRAPAVLAITGAFAAEDYLSRVPDVMPAGWRGFVTHLPGNHCPKLRETSVAAFAKALDEAAAHLGGPVIALGVSVGALVALAMKTPVGIMAVEPPLSTGKLWPMTAGLRATIEADPEFWDAIFGYRLSGGEARRYHHLIQELRVPTTILVGSDPLLPKRSVSRYPSFVDEADRQFLKASPWVSLHVAPGAGHDVPLQAAAFMHPHLLSLCAATLPVPA